jgi:hypothetical protein
MPKWSMTRRLFNRRCVALVALVISAGTNTASAIDVGPGSVSFDFATAPGVTDFSTSPLPAVGNSETIGNQVQLDSTVQMISVDRLTSPLPSSATFPPSSNASFRYNTNPMGQFLQSHPVGPPLTVGLARLTNSSPNYVTSLDVNYTFGRILDPGESEIEEVPGQTVYYSGTGEAGSWTKIDTFATPGHVAFSLPDLGTSFRNTFYLLWADDNAVATSTSGEAAYTIDDLSISRTLGGPKPPEFGFVTPDQLQTFDGGGLMLFNASTAVLVTRADGPGGESNNSLQVNNAVLNAVTEQVDLRGASGPVVVGIDVKAWETAEFTDFESNDHIIITVETSNDGFTFQAMELLNLHGADNPPNPADQIRAAFPANEEFAPYGHFELTLPAGTKSTRLRIDLAVNSMTEFIAIDNISVREVPEPASVATIGLGMVGLVGYGIRRQSASCLPLGVNADCVSKRFGGQLPQKI